MRISAFVKERTVCKDGFSMSVQDSIYHYCEPGISSEVGFPSENEELLNPYYDDGQVWPYVPNEVIEAIVSKHGGRV